MLTKASLIADSGVAPTIESMPVYLNWFANEMPIKIRPATAGGETTSPTAAR